MKAEIIAIGSELLTPERIDTNSLYLTEKLNEIGIDVHLKTIVGDDEANLERVVRSARERSDLIISSGGLGPTEDDVTKQVFARVLGRELQLDEKIVEWLKQRFAKYGFKMPEINVRQAYIPVGAIVLTNHTGTAPGVWMEEKGVKVVLLPGPPRELKPMFDREVFPRLQALSGDRRLLRRVLKIAGLTESRTDSLAAPVYTQYKDIRTTILASPGSVELHISVVAEPGSEAERRLSELEEKIAAVLGDHLYSRSGENLEEVVGQSLLRHKATLAVAESCTGGLIAERITRVPGASVYLLGSVVCYSEAAKVDLCGVAPELLREKGPVSAEVVERMAERIRERFGATIGLAVTGIAGPSGGTPETPVGLVFIGLACAGRVFHKRFQFPGDREVVRFLASQSALDLVRREMKDEG
jgi:nicotinamide-nucleotide amidase